MRNYGEELVYWYFRLNGFIPMADFVLHGDDALQSSDCDLLAVRFPHVFETVGGQENDWDDEFLNALGHDGKKTLAVFVQVKAGEDDGNRVERISRYFSSHLEYLINRLGFWPPDRAKDVADRFDRVSVLEEDQYSLSNVTVLRDIRSRRRTPQWIEVPISQAIHFIMNRMTKYAPDKFNDRMFFPDSVIQLLADQAHTPRHRWPSRASSST